MKLTINLCTRKRPALLLETVRRTLPNMDRRDTTLMISVDRDDIETIGALTNLPQDKRILPIVMDREDSLGGKYNRALRYAPADVYLAMVDYAPHETPGFDQRVLDAAAVFPDNIGVIYNHYCCDAELPAINGITAGLAKKMGYIYPEYFPFSIVDLWLDDIARLIDRISFADVVIDRSNRQPTTGRRDVKFWGILLDLLYPERLACAKMIINSWDFKEAPWRKQLLLRNIPHKMQHAYRTSKASRANADWNDRYAVFENDAERVRYLAIRERAEALMRKLVGEAEARNRVAAE